MGVSSAKKSPSKMGRSTAREHRSPSKALKEELSPSKDSAHSHLLPDEKQKKSNGRVSGRSLIIWNRPRMAEKLLLHMYYECIRYKMSVPWDAIAHRLHPGSSGTAVVQYLNRMRRDLVSEGHLVPPMPQKPGTSSNVDPRIRGYVRKDPDSSDRETTRPVYYDEHIPDAKFNLPDGFDSRDPAVEEQCVAEEHDEDVNAASPLSSRPPLFVTPKKMRRSSSITSSNQPAEKAMNGNGTQAALDAVDEDTDYQGSCFSTPQNKRPYDYGPELSSFSRSLENSSSPRPSFDRPSLQPEPQMMSWQDSHGVYFLPHPPGMMPIAGGHHSAYTAQHPRFQPRMFPSPWAFPVPQIDNSHPAPFGMPVPSYPGSDQDPSAPITPPQHATKVESPEKTAFSDDGQRTVATDYMSITGINGCELDTAL